MAWPQPNCRLRGGGNTYRLGDGEKRRLGTLVSRRLGSGEASVSRTLTDRTQHERSRASQSVLADRIIGRGSVGAGLAGLLETAGHEVTTLGREGGDASDTDVVMVAVPGNAIEEAIGKVYAGGLENARALEDFVVGVMLPVLMAGRGPFFYRIGGADDLKELSGPAFAFRRRLQPDPPRTGPRGAILSRSS